ncbi:chemotaxis protein CheW [Ramlibacter albus]|uniref:Chemotaxis protein CheW n=1 Tax=Ramlibacter albus TaxID=2079448 RepID=A0A923S510_9BURK|nr:chemotaxis protein CheW [Ramlibacter albus]MBC5768036.1 chemotaxis protein CheW [Ramlibacter albus]
MRRDFESLPQPSAAGTSRAWLLPLRRGGWWALPSHATLEVVEQPRAVPVPGAPRHALGLLAWQGRWIALLDVDVLAGEPVLEQPRYALVVAWQPAPGRPLEHAAVALDALPELFLLPQDCPACELPEPAGVWRHYAVSCFVHGGHAVPIIDSARLFG